jgi:hypothetical protein
MRVPLGLIDGNRQRGHQLKATERAAISGAATLDVTPTEIAKGFNLTTATVRTTLPRPITQKWLGNKASKRAPSSP